MIVIDADVLGRNRTGEETYVLNLLRQLPVRGVIATAKGVPHATLDVVNGTHTLGIEFPELILQRLRDVVEAADASDEPHHRATNVSLGSVTRTWPHPVVVRVFLYVNAVAPVAVIARVPLAG